MTEPLRVVADAGPIIHLDELRCLDLLQDFPRLLVPRVVWMEAAHHRPALRIERIPGAGVVDEAWHASPRLVTLFDAMGLHAGERAALALAEHARARLLLCDDAAARLAAESAGFAVRGTLGLLVRSIRRGFRRRDQVLRILKDLPHQSSLHIAPVLLQRVMAMVESEAADK